MNSIDFYWVEDFLMANKWAIILEFVTLGSDWCRIWLQLTTICWEKWSNLEIWQCSSYPSFGGNIDFLFSVSAVSGTCSQLDRQVASLTHISAGSNVECGCQYSWLSMKTTHFSRLGAWLSGPHRTENSPQVVYEEGRNFTPGYQGGIPASELSCRGYVMRSFSCSNLVVGSRHYVQSIPLFLWKSFEKSWEKFSKFV